MDPYYIQPGTPVYFEIRTLHGIARRTLHGFVQSDTGAYVTVIVPSMNHKTVFPPLLLPSMIYFKESNNHGYCL